MPYIKNTAGGTNIVNSVKLKQKYSVTKKKVLNFPDFTVDVESFIFHTDLFMLSPNMKHILE